MQRGPARGWTWILHCETAHADQLGAPILQFRAVTKLYQSEGRFWVDYGYHVAPIEAAHIDEIEHLALDRGITSFKIFMFLWRYGLVPEL
jgi:hypothetical protein